MHFIGSVSLIFRSGERLKPKDVLRQVKEATLSCFCSFEGETCALYQCFRFLGHDFKMDKLVSSPEQIKDWAEDTVIPSLCVM